MYKISTSFLNHFLGNRKVKMSSKHKTLILLNIYNKMKRNLIITCLIGALGIILGAFAAHSLKNTLDADALKSFETGVRYQMYHVIVLLFVNTFQGFSAKTKNTISYMFFAGILLFSGSIYAIYLLNINPKSIWFITPLGGLIFIFGWLYMLYAFSKTTSK